MKFLIKVKSAGVSDETLQKIKDRFKEDFYSIGGIIVIDESVDVYILDDDGRVVQKL